MTEELDSESKQSSFSNGVGVQVSLMDELHSESSMQIRPGARSFVNSKFRAPASWSQQRLWFIDKLGGTSTAYHWSIWFRLHGALEVDALRSALTSIVRRHETLRTIFSNQGGELIQEILHWANIELKIDDAQKLDLPDREGRVQALKQEELRTPFDLETGPLVRSRLIQLGAREHVLLITMHHIVSDGWSIGVIQRELSGLYRAHLEGREEGLDPLPFQYADYVQWERRWLQGNRLEQQLAYWRSRLKGSPSHIELPTDHPRPPVQSYRGSFVSLEIDRALTVKLKRFAERHGLSIFMALLGSWAILLSRICGVEDVVIGTPVANRQHPGVERLIGFFVNMLPLRLKVSDPCSVDEFFDQVCDVALSAYENQAVPFDKIVEDLHPKRDLARHPVFQVALVFQNTPKSPMVLEGLEVSEEDIADETARFDLLMSLEEKNGGIRGDVSYAADIFDRETVIKWVRSFEVLLEEVAGDSGNSLVGVLRILSRDERVEVLEGFNPAPQEVQDQVIQELFEERVRLHPERIAVSCEGESLTYGELNVKANQLAWYLRDRGVGPDQLVGICMERSLELVVGLFGILKAGGAYVPLDPGYPAERLAYMLGDAAPSVVLSQARVRGRLPPSEASVIALDEDWGEIGKCAARDLPAESLDLRPDHLAYVIYTSGSTGRPKGAMNEHRGVVNRLTWMQQQYRLGPQDRVLQKTPFSFDVSVWEFFWPLMTGAHLIVARPGGHQDPGYLVQLIEETGVTTLHFVPSMLQAFLGQHQMGRCPSIRHIVCSGEELSPALQNKCLEQLPQAQLSNLYGPTECAVDVTAWECRKDESNGRVPIGRPIANTRIYVLDRCGQPVPIGVVGEVHIGGVQVGRGYLNRPELTEERFVPDPFSAEPKGRMYKTGDLGRWRADGTIEYLGRNDEQVKIRGFRIELGEIEAQLVRHAGVKEAVVLAREDVPGERRLVGYVIAREGAAAPSAESLREHLKGVLPEYMVPSAFVVLEGFPLTPNGKLDRRALPAPDLSAYTSREYEAPRGEVEEILVGIWQELLRVERVGRHDNFFELGGHSLLIVQMMERLRRVGLSAEVRRVFDSPTLSDLAGTLIRGAGEQIEVPPNLIPPGCERITPQMLPLVQLEQEHIDRIVQAVPGGAANVQDIYPLAPLQEGILFHHLLNGPGRDAYVRPMLYETSSKKRLDDLLSALQAIVDRHDILRTAVMWERLPRGVQVVCRKAMLSVNLVTLDPERDPLEQLNDRMNPEYVQLDLRRAPLVKVQTAAAPDGTRWYAIVCTHHLVCDNESQNVLFAELAAHLGGHIEELPQPRPYRDHVAQALAYARKSDAQVFFRNKLGDVEDSTAPFGLLDVRGDGSDIDGARQDLEADLGKRLRGRAQRMNVTPATLFHAAWALAVAKTSGREDVVFGTVLVGRLQGTAGAQQVLGMFINTLPLRVHLQGVTAKALVEMTQRELVELIGHEQASLAEAQRCSGVSDPTPLFTTLLNYRHSVTEADQTLDSPPGVTLLASHGRTNYPVLLSVDDRVDGFGLEVEADRRIDPERMLRYACTAVSALVEALESAPSTPALSLQVLPDAERREVLEGFNAVQQYQQEELIQELFEGQARLHPDAIAVTYEGQSLTYGELNARANQLAWHLRERGVGADQLVGVCLHRSLQLVVGLLGVLKAGAGYLPLDPSYPAERLAYMLGDAAPSVVLTQEELRRQLPQSAAEVVTIDADWELIDRHSKRNPALRPQGLSSDRLAYVIYTSGSTGKPKGVMVEHRNVVRLLAATESWFGFGRQDVWTLFHSFAFDFSVWELWGALLYGGRVVIVPHLTARSPQEFYRLLCREGVTVLNQTPSAFAQLIEAQSQCADLKHALRVVILGGEALEFRTLRPWVQRNGAEQPQLINMYGITETTVHVTYRRLTKEEIESERGSIIGRPIPDLKTYLLDRHGQPVPIGVVGEIHVGGAGVARGYLNRPELTEERFVPDPFSAEPKGRMYKTGDLGRWRADGTIEYLGRNDEQVKIRGFRIELGEIEAQLVRHAGVKEAVVLAREDVPGERRLVGYVIAREGAAAPSAESLREHLKGVLPEYMVPSAFVVLEGFPLTPNGKLDRRALPAPDLSAYTSREYEAPRGEVEEILVGIWQELLRVERVGRHDNFFELGGHSLLIVQMMERLRRVGLSAEVRRVFDSPTLSDLAGTLIRGAGEQIEVPPNLIPPGCERITPQMLPLVQLEQEHIDRIVQAVPGGAANVQDIYPLAPLQEGMLFHHLFDPQRGDTYVLSTLLAVSSEARLRELISALQAVIDRHDILRTAVSWEQLPRPVQVVYRRATLLVEEIVLDTDEDLDEQMEIWLRPERQRLDLRRAPPVRLQIAAARDGGWRAILQLHHITTDHLTTEVIISEVVAYLEGHTERLIDSLPYRNHVAQALAYASAHDAHVFFTSKFSDVEESTAPFGRTEVFGDGSQAIEVQQHIDPLLATRLRAQARRLTVSAATLFHAAWALVVSHTSGRDDVVFGTVLLGRIQGSAGAQRSLGVFINTLPIRLRTAGTTARKLVEQTQHELVELISYEQSSLAEAQRCSSVPSGQPLFATLLNYRHSIPNSESEWARAQGIREIACREHTNYPLMMSVDDFGNNFGLTVQADPYCDPQRILRYACKSIESLVESLENAPETPAGMLRVLPEDERRLMIESLNATWRHYPQHKLVHELFEEQAVRSPNSVAVEHEGRCLTYAQLNRRANQLARYLVSQGVGADQVIGICMERGLDMVVGVLGILKAGCAYLPLDPNYPTERLRQMLEDAAPQIMLTETELVGVLPASQARVIALDENLGQIAAYIGEDLQAAELALNSENLVYVIYTSGSTGTPKGTAMRHRSMVNLIEWHRNTFGPGEGHRVLQFAAFSFDVAFQETFSTLCTGGTLVLLDEWVRRDAQALTELLTKRAIHRLFIPPLMLQSVAEYCKSANQAPLSLRDIITAGEQLRLSPEIRELIAHLTGCRLHNHYGPTETHVVTALTLEGDPAQWPALPSIGRPIANTQIYVLNGQMQPVPIEVAGEIYIGGANVARGYLNRSELTEQRFVPDPYSSEPRARLYKTGDLGRWREDGTLEYLGRNDDQVKIRGFRVELKEIEAQLARHERIREVAVVVREDTPGQKRLVAYTTLRNGASPNTEELRTHLKTVLPEHMVPSAFMVLDALPLAPSGKLDRRALPAPELHSYVTKEYEPPRGEVEEILAAIWQEVLHVERVGRNDNFFELGGHSLLIVQMMERVRRVGLSAEVRRVFQSPTLSDLARSLIRGGESDQAVPANLIPPGCKRVTPEMLPLVDLEQEHLDRIAHTVAGGMANIQDIYPLAPLQEGILFHHLLSQSSGDTYVIPTLLQFSCRQALGCFVAAMTQMIERHDALRAAVLWEYLPRPVQVVYREALLVIEQLEFDRALKPLDQFKALMRPECQKLDLRHAPLMRLRVAADAASERWFGLLQMHHAICDHESLDTLYREIAALMSEGESAQLPTSVAYRKHVAQALSHGTVNDAPAFFRRKLQGVAASTAPFGLNDVRLDPSRIVQGQTAVEPQLARRVRAQARRFGVSAATLFHAAWALVIASCSAKSDVVFGTVLLGRLQGSAGGQGVLGMFMNTLPLRLKLDDISSKKLIEVTQRELVELIGHEQASLAVAQRGSTNLGSAPLFSALLNYRHSAASVDGKLQSLGVSMLDIVSFSNYPLTLSVDDYGEEFGLVMDTERSLDPFRVLAYVTTVIGSLVEALEGNSDTPVLSLQVLPDAERREVLEGFNAVQQYQQEELIQELFEGQARLHPDAIAVTYEGQSLTYGELNARANQLAWHLRERGVGADQLVGVCLHRSLQLVVGLLGVLKAGAGYLPLDPSYPAERLAYMLGDAAPSVVLTQEELRRQLPQSAAEVVTIDADWELIDRHSKRNPALRPQGLSSDRLAYVIYTSGSTGKPKGVMVEHRNVVRLLAATESWFGFGRQDVWTLFHSFAFDFSVWELWGALLYGGRVVIVPHLTARSPQEFYRLLCREGVTVLNQTPSAFAQLIEAQSQCADLKHALRVVILGGEALEFRTLRPWVQRNGAEQPQLINMYGITETTVHVTYRRLTKEEIESERGSIIGRPIPDLKTYLLDRHGQPVPIGVVGEIHVGGAGVARGYLNRPELTEERFVPDPFSAEPKGRMYKTGDLGRWRADGTIEYLGRNDEQVKIRGFRIELGEIEAQLVRHAGVKEAVVLAREDVPGERRLVGYVIAREGAAAPSAESLREHLKGVLPEYMVPSAFVVLEGFPLTPNGKLDRRALPAPDLSAYTSREYEAPRGEVEEILVGIWQELLRVERVGRHDNFFELGGHSLLIVQMMERLRRVGLSAEVRRVFDSPTLSDLAGTLIRGAGEQIEVPPNLIPPGCERITPQMLPLVQLEQEHIDRIVQAVPGGAANVQDIYPLAPLQEGMLFHHLFDPQGPDTYVLPLLLAVSVRDRVDELIDALQAIIERHDVLRTAIIWERMPKPVQVVYRRAQLRVDEVRLYGDVGTREQVDDWMSPATLRLDLTKAPLVRLKVAQDPHENLWYVLIRFHHVTCDHITTEILTGELVSKLRKQASLVPDAVPYRNHVAQMLSSAREQDSMVFFRGKLGPVDQPTAPFGVLEVYGDGSGVQEAFQELSADISARLRAQARRAGVSAATLFHAAWALVVARISGRDDVVFGTMLMGRLQGSLGIQRALGMFINTLPLRIQLVGCSAKDLIEQAQRELVELLGHEHASLAMAQRCSSIAGSIPLFTALLNFRHSTQNPEGQWDSATGFRVLAGHDYTNYPITMSVDDLGAGFSLTAQTDQGIEPQRILTYLSAAVGSLVEALEHSSGTQALALAVMPDAERVEVLEGFNPAPQEVQDQVIQELFEERVRLHPERIAVSCEGESLTYGELNVKANQLAWYLRDRGVGPDQLVGICMERSLELVVGLFGILKAGGAYVPLDPGYPAERLAYMLGDAAPSVVLSQARVRGRLPPSEASVIALDEDWGEIGKCAARDLPAESLDLRPDHLAYVIYTSGSTGRPKGAMNEHRGVVNRLTWMQQQYRLGPQDRVLQKTPFSFDVSVWEFFWPLMTGAHLIVARPGGHQDPGYLVQLIEETGVTTLHFVPSMLQAFLGQHQMGRCPSIRHIVCSGEELSPALQNKCLEQLPQAQLSNLYGPTECAVDVTAWECRKDESNGRVPIGRPIANTRIYVLDRCGQPVPIGVVGEVHIGGVQVGRGYLNRPELTEERFVPDPFSAEPKGRMYKTGDLGRWRADGTIEYLGRNDEQVKIRGFRIELGEIEAQLVRHAGVKEAVVLAREDVPGERRLVGYVIAREGAAAPSAESLREHLKGVLPEYMVPSAFVVLEGFPLTPNGKLDRRALPAPDLSAYTSREYEAPRGEVEEILVGIWQELLRVERVGRHDNFFELGGHSLLGIKLIARIGETLGLLLPASAVFRHPTVSRMTSLIESLRSSDVPTVVAEHEEYEEGEIPLYASAAEPALSAPEAP